MNEEQAPINWQELKRQAEQEPCPGILGLDLITGKMLHGANAINVFPLQVFGKDDFLRNMLQRILEADVFKKSDSSSILVIVPPDESKLFGMVHKILRPSDSEDGHQLFFYKRYETKRSADLRLVRNLLKDESPSFMSGKTKHLYMALGRSLSRPLNDPLLLHLNKEMEKKFQSKGFSFFRPVQPFVYLFYPEKMGPRSHVAEYIQRIQYNAIPRIFSEDLHVFFDHDDKSIVYGPGLFPKETCERMKQHFCRQAETGWAYKKRGFWIMKEDRILIKEAETLIASIPVTQTGFARFKNEYSRKHENFWFYPIQQGLGSLAYRRPLFPHSDGAVAADPFKKTTRPQDPLAKVMNDLRPEN